MIIDNLNLVYFSPTGTTQKIVKTIGKTLEKNLKTTSFNDFDLTKESSSVPHFNKNSISIIGSPVYAGRLPMGIAKKLEKLEGNNSIAVIIVTYGNRAFEDSLLELKNILKNAGFRILAAAAFIGEHSFSTDDKPIAKDRPDSSDLSKCIAFSERIQTKIKDIEKLADISIPGNYPYKELPQLPSLSPQTDEILCDLCGICENICPVEAIQVDSEVVTNTDACIWCCACIKSCPNEARFLSSPIIKNITEKLTVLERKEPEFFL
jgi:ferredoxin/menaquinone-dependent protoporphyrinogen IX oxidase